ncbi:CIC11C00000005844 [Sungouiella intermedia]|uniref:CIC11C00000005844 n=1 Tax=Sungouiella intermedia TaxID=45354 RepID=A0A1L0FV28_9ASCO|nr:CIC11C00000005844 [[Candida] intermedia]
MAASSTAIAARLFRSQRYMVLLVVTVFVSLLIITSISAHEYVNVSALPDKVNDYYQSVKGASGSVTNSFLDLFSGTSAEDDSDADVEDLGDGVADYANAENEWDGLPGDSKDESNEDSNGELGESQEESKGESKEESTEESKEDSTEESKEDSTEESKEKSTEDSKDESEEKEKSKDKSKQKPDSDFNISLEETDSGDKENTDDVVKDPEAQVGKKKPNSEVSDEENKGNVEAQENKAEENEESEVNADEDAKLEDENPGFDLDA